MNKKKLLALLMALVMTLTLVPVTAFADDVTPSASTTGYNGEKLPEGPANMDGNVIDVNATNAQYVLDGAYGDINGKTINFTENVTDALDLARPTKYSGSGTTSTGNTYSRTLNNVTFTANSGVELAGFYFHPGHIYGNDDFTKYNYVEDRSVTSTNDGYYRHSTLSKITFSGLTVKGSATTAPFDFIGSLDNATVSEITFNGCTITNDNGNAIQFNNNGNLRYGTITISNCNINGSGMGVYVNSAGDGTIALNNNIIFGGSNNAIQITRLSDGTGSVSITGNYLKSNKYAVNLNNYTSETITLTGNAVVAGTRGHLGHFKGDASGNFWAPQGTTLTENNTVTTTLSSPTADTQADQGENEITCSSAFDTALLNTSADKWVTLSNSASTPVAQIGEIPYTTLQAAFDNAQAGETVVLLQNVSENVTVAESKNIVIDLAGHTINGGTVANAPAITNNGTLEIKDTVGGGVVQREDTGKSGYYVIDNAGTLIISSGTYTNGTGSASEHSGASLIRTRENATLTIKGGTLNQEFFNVLKDEGNCTVNITGGTINCAGAEYAILTYGDLNISGGNINGPVDIRGYDSISGAATISGGTFNSKFYVEQYTDHHASTNPSLIIEGGQFTTDADTFNVGEGKKPSNFTPDPSCGTIVISGGIFTDQPDAGLIKTGYQVITNPDGATVADYPYTVKFKYSGQIAWNAESDKDIEIVDGMSVTNVWLMLGNKTSGFNFGEISFGSEDADAFYGSEDADAFDTIDAFYNSFLNHYLGDPEIQGYMDQFGVDFLKLKYTSIVFPTVDVPADVDVCTVDGVGYHSVKLAVDAIAKTASKTGTIVMVQDYTTACAVVIPEGVNVTLDLAGHTLSAGLEATNRHVYAIENYGTFTLVDSGTDGKITSRGIWNKENATMTVNSGTVVDQDQNGGAAVWNEGNLVINDGTFSTTYVGSASETYGPACLSNQATGTAQINGGLFQSVNNRAYAVMNYGTMVVDNATVDGTHGGISCDTGSLTINGGSYTAKNYYGLWITNNGNVTDVTVNGGYFKGGSDGKNAIRASVDDGKQDVSDATIRITGGKFEGYSGNAAAVAVNKSGSAHSWGMNITGGEFSTKPDNSYVAEGYEAVLLTANNIGTIGNEYIGWYKVGKVITSDPQESAAAEGFDKTYTATKTVNATSDPNSQLLSSETTVTVNVKANQEDGLDKSAATKAPAQLNNLTQSALQKIVSDAVDNAPSGENSTVEVEIKVVKSEATVGTNKVSYEVHPEAVITAGGNTETIRLTNDQLDQTQSFTFKLDVTGVFADGTSVYVTHRHENGTSEVLGPVTVKTENEKQYVTVSGVKQFSEFDVTSTDGGAVGFNGASLRRRIKTINNVKTTTVVNSSTDIRFTYEWKLPNGATGLKSSENESYFLWRKNSADEWKTVYITNVSGNTASLVINGVPEGAFGTVFETQIHLTFDNGTVLDSNVHTRSVTQVATVLAETARTEANKKWVDYGKHLLKELTGGYDLSTYDETI